MTNTRRTHTCCRGPNSSAPAFPHTSCVHAQPSLTQTQSALKRSRATYYATIGQTCVPSCRFRACTRRLKAPGLKAPGPPLSNLIPPATIIPPGTMLWPDARDALMQQRLMGCHSATAFQLQLDATLIPPGTMLWPDARDALMQQRPGG